ncbi:MAG: pyridoxal phosphate-dependent aminotransferase [Candidatus Aenigmarchaeota archaeon]|nr:pyridoxal phosphate-dependent aminotransferase [Candidatus Aenigmarchaeota archaeon]
MTRTRKLCKPLISERELELPKTHFLEIMKIAEESKDIISLGPGEPDFITPKHIRDFVKKQLDLGKTHYTSIGGITEVKESLGKKLRKENKIDVDPESQIIVTAGAKEAILLSLMSLMDPGDSAIVPNPGYVAYIPIIDSLNGRPHSLQLRPDEGWEYDLDRAKKLITDKTALLILNSPSNPTGTVFSRKKLEEIADFALDNCLVILSDEAYEKFVYDDAKHVSIASLNGMENHVVSIYSFSKTYAMAGFRVGYAAGPKDIIQAMTRLKLGTTLSTPTLSQLAAKHAVESTQKPVQAMLKEYTRRGKLMYRRLTDMDLDCENPQGAFYMFPSIKKFGMSSTEFSKFLLEKAKVLVVPGTEFGKYGEGFVRMSYATEYQKIEQAMNRIEKAVNKL